MRFLLDRFLLDRFLMLQVHARYHRKDTQTFPPAVKPPAQQCESVGKAAMILMVPFIGQIAGQISSLSRKSR